MHKWTDLHWLIPIWWEDIYILPLIICLTGYFGYQMYDFFKKYKKYTADIWNAIHTLEQDLKQSSQESFYAWIHQVFRIYFAHKNIPYSQSSTRNEILRYKNISQKHAKLFDEIYTKEFTWWGWLNIIQKQSLLTQLKKIL